MTHKKNEMRTKIKLTTLILLGLTIVGCQNFEKKEENLNKEEKQLVQQKFGKLKTEDDNLEVELKTVQFNNWTGLAGRVKEIVCNDSLPIIKLTTDKQLKTIYLHNVCRDDDSFPIIKQKNVFEIHNDTMMRNETSFPMDSLKSVLTRDIINKGKNLDKLTILISYNNEFQSLPKTLNRLTETYEKITNKRDINIRLVDKGDFRIPPRPKTNQN